MVEGSQVLCSRPAEGVACLTISNPGRLNSLTPPSGIALTAEVERAGRDPDVRAVVITGAGRAFSSGADLDNLRDDPPTREQLDECFAVIDAIRLAPIPVIASIDGPAAGGAWGIALACDIRLASPHSTFLAPFVEIELVPDYGLSESLPRLAGTDHALEICLSGRPVSASEAHQRGLVTKITPEPLAAAVELGRDVTRHSRASVARIKAQLLEGDHHSEAELQARLLRAPGFPERLERWRRRGTAPPATPG